MWWQPANERDGLLAAAVERLGVWFREARETSRDDFRYRAALGVGSIWVPSREALFPFVLLNSEWAHTTKRRYPRGKLFLVDRDKHASIGHPELSLPLYGLVLYPPECSDGPSRAELELCNWEGAVDELVRVRRPITAPPSLKFGSAGVLVRKTGTGRYAFLTAGHVMPDQIGATVEQCWMVGPARISSISWRRQRVGSLIHRIVPTSQVPEWDVAVVELDDQVRPKSRATTQGVLSYPGLEEIAVQGAVTGLAPKVCVQGAMTAIEYDDGQRMWKNCWLVAPSGVLRRGDSGAAAFLKSDGKLLGVYVGGSRYDRSKRPIFHYVQDAHTMSQQLFAGWGVDWG